MMRVFSAVRVWVVCAATLLCAITSGCSQVLGIETLSASDSDAGPMPPMPDGGGDSLSDGGMLFEDGGSDPAIDGGLGGGSGDAGSIDIDAGGNGSLLAVDCQNSDNRSLDICRAPSQVAPRVFGSGPSLKEMNAGFTQEYAAGFIDGQHLILFAHWNSSADQRGYVVRVHLSTGDREVISGEYDDPASGPQRVGSGPEFAWVSDMEKGADGYWYALNPVSGVVQLMRIDPTTGHREIIWDDDNDAAFNLCLTGQDPPIARNMTSKSFAIGDSGEFYFSVSDNPLDSGRGIVKVTVDGTNTACEVMSMYDGPEGDNRGAGITFPNGRWYGVTFHQGAVYAVLDLNSTLVRFATQGDDIGDRIVISSQDRGVGIGPELGTGTMLFDYVRSQFFTTADFLGGSGGVILADPETGDRELLAYESAPALSSSEGPAWPLENGLIVMISGDYGIVLFDPNTGNSNLLSL